MSIVEKLGLSANLAYTLELDMETPSNNVIKNMHFFAYKKMRSHWKMLVIEQLGRHLPVAPVAKSFLVIDRYCAGEGLDWDNAYGGLKPLLDCLVVPSKRNPDGLGLILDDNPTNMPYPPFMTQHKAKKNEGKTIVQIYAIAS